MTSILEDRDGRLWLGTYGGGLERFDPETERFTHFRHDPTDPTSLSGDRVSSLAEAADGRLWVGTMEKGLNLLDPRTGRFERFEHRPGRSRQPALGRRPRACTWTRRERSGWARTAASATCRRTAAPSRPSPRATACPSDVVYGIRSDRQGRLWLSTNNGLSCFDPRSGQFTNYGVSDGLQASEFNFGAWYQSTSGELFFGGINGFNAFVPDRLRQLAQAPPVVLTSVSVDHRPLGGPADETQQIRLGFRTRCWASSSPPSTSPPRSATGSPTSSRASTRSGCPSAGRRDVTYTNLNPGRYTFRLRGANSDGRWNEEGLAVAVDVAAAPWATAWAYAGYSLLLRRRRARPGARAAAQVRARGRVRARARVPRAGADAASCRSASSSWSGPTRSWPRPASPTR